MLHTLATLLLGKESLHCLYRSLMDIRDAPVLWRIESTLSLVGIKPCFLSHIAHSPMKT
jgi:hypothetical protein